MTGTRLTRPNVIVILTDDQESQNDLGQQMPYLSSRPYGSWVTFPTAHLGVPLCTPSRSTILTGQRVLENHVWNNTSAVTGGAYGAAGNNGNNPTAYNLDESRSIFVALRNAQYRTGIIGKYVNDYGVGSNDHHIPPGVDTFFCPAGGESTYSWLCVTETGSTVQGDGTAASYFTNVIMQRAQTFINKKVSGADTRPFFLYLPIHEPHTPAEPPAQYQNLSIPYASTSAGDTPDWNRLPTNAPAWLSGVNPTGMTTAQINGTRSERLNQYRSLRGLDDNIKTLFDYLNANGLLDSTVIIFATDNGINLGQHGLSSADLQYQKRSPYEYASRTPFLVRYPGARQRSDPRIVSMLDVPASVLAWANATPLLTPAGLPLDPVLLEGHPVWRSGNEYMLKNSTGQIPDWNAYRWERWRYAEYATGEVDLHDLNADPWELRNLAYDPAFAAVRAESHYRLGAALADASFNRPRTGDAMVAASGQLVPVGSRQIAGPDGQPRTAIRMR